MSIDERVGFREGFVQGQAVAQEQKRLEREYSPTNQLRQERKVLEEKELPVGVWAKAGYLLGYFMK